jgi:hypothetical protein
MEWTAAACVVAVQGCITIAVGLMLFVPMALGQADGWYKAYHQKKAALNENLIESPPDYLQKLELEMGSHICLWGMATMALLMAGGDAQIICILEMAPMLALVVYFFRCDEKVYTSISSAFVGAFFYFGVLTSPNAPSVEFDGADILVVVHTLLCLPFAILYLIGKTEELSKANPEAASWFSANREREILMGTTLVGLAVASIGAIMTNVAGNYCILVWPAPLLGGIGHWITMKMKEAMPGIVFAVLFLGVGILTHVM